MTEQEKIQELTTECVELAVKAVTEKRGWSAPEQWTAIGQIASTLLDHKLRNFTQQK